MAEALSITCSQCGAAIPAEDVNIDTVLARCRACDAVFDFSEQVSRRRRATAARERDGGGDGRRGDNLDVGVDARDDDLDADLAGEGATHRLRRQPVGRPGGIRLEPEPGGGLKLVRSWRTPAVGFLVLFTLFWDGFLVFWYFIAFTQNGPLMMKIFPLLHVLVGVFMTWYTLALLLNRTVITVNYQQVKVRHRPMWWPGNRTLEAASIVRLEVKRSSVQKNDQSLWNVMADTTDDRRFALVSHLEDRDHALYLEQEIEKFLDLKPR